MMTKSNEKERRTIPILHSNSWVQTIAEKMTNRQTTVHKTQHRKLNNKKHEPYLCLWASFIKSATMSYGEKPWSSVTSYFCNDQSANYESPLGSHKKYNYKINISLNNDGSCETLKRMQEWRDMKQTIFCSNLKLKHHG